jgi:hypothetical protein
LRDGHRESWWVAELAFLHFGPRKAARALCVTTDRRRLPSQTTWYLSSNLKGSSLEEIIQLYAWPTPLLAKGTASGASLAGSFPLAHALLESLGAGTATRARNAA